MIGFSFFSLSLWRIWRLLAQLSQKLMRWLWRTSPRTATTMCFPVSDLHKATSLSFISNTPYSWNHIIAYHTVPATIIAFLILTLYTFFHLSDDSSRVKLSIIHGSPYDDYINANYMPVRTENLESSSQL